MVTSPVSVFLPTATLLADYTRWLDFLAVSRCTLRRYDRQLMRISNRYPDLSHLSNYLRNCMHQRAQFFGNLTIQLTGKVAQLRTSTTNEALNRQLTAAHPVMQALITQLETAFAGLVQSYGVLFPFRQFTSTRPAPPVAN